jgi:hypothetical protein
MNAVRHDLHDFDQNAVLCCRRQQDILESSLDITEEDLAPVFWAPDDVLLEAKHCPRVRAVPAISATWFNDHVLSVGLTTWQDLFAGLPVACRRQSAPGRIIDDLDAHQQVPAPSGAHP